MTAKRVGFLVISIVMLFSVSAVHAQMLIETAVSRSQLMVGERMTLDIVISDATGAIKAPEFPALDGFNSYSQGRSQEISFINGQSSSKYIFSYVLIAQSPGKKKIGPFQVNIGGRDFAVAAVEVEVLPNQSSSTASGMTGPVSAPHPKAIPTQLSNQDIFAKAWLDKNEVYVNEPSMLTYTLFTRLNATYKGFDKEPVTTGFWVEDFPPEKTIKRQEQIFNNSRYVVADVRKIALFPTEPGVFTIDTGVLGANVEIRDQDDFDSFMSAGVFGYRNPRVRSIVTTQVVPRLIPTESVALVVKALPDKGKPVNFSGAVGRYEIESSVDKTQVEEGSPVTYRIRISGQGNINTVDVPSLPKTDNFKVYDSSSTVNIPKTRLVVEGEKIVETVVVPKKAGIFTVPTLNFSYFDPQTEKYVEIATKPHTLMVSAAAHTDSNDSVTGGGLDAPVERNSVAPLNEDIRYIRANADAPLVARWAPRLNPFFWPLNIVLAVLAALFAIFSHSRSEELRDARGYRLRRSHKVARNRLRAAAAKMKEGQRDLFYSEMSKALYHYFADKLNVSAQTVDMSAIASSLDNSAQSTDLVRKIESLFGELAKGRYSSLATGPEEMQTLYNQADDVITAFEKAKSKR